MGIDRRQVQRGGACGCRKVSSLQTGLDVSAGQHRIHPLPADQPLPTGINFTEYVSRLRTEKAKNLLLNPNLRVSEIAYEVGFQSLTHFNRVFKKVVGESPTEYRGHLRMA